MTGTVAELLDEAAAAPVAGWDWAWSSGRIEQLSSVPWDFTALTAAALGAATAALDMGTGGGEFLDGFADLPRFADVGALARYLRMVAWAVPGFDVTTHRRALESAADRDLVVHQERFLLSCRRPDP